MPENRDLAGLLSYTVSKQASDLHLSEGRVPVVRIDGVLSPVEGAAAMARREMEEIVRKMAGEDKFEDLAKERKELDLAYEDGANSRFRVNVFSAGGRIGISFRTISKEIIDPRGLNLPAEIDRFTETSQGFVLFTGPTGHGKTTTMASLVNKINRDRVAHIITIEDPIEYVYREDKCLIHQREVGLDTRSFSQALKMTLREDPNVVVIGEMRDPESIATALTIAETGHLVFATLHTNDAAQTVDRIIDVFPAQQQQQIRVQLSATLTGIVSQRLLRRIDGGRVPACEILVANTAVRNLIREGETVQIPGVIQTGVSHGMVTLDRSLKELVKKKLVTPEEAAFYSHEQAIYR